VYYLLTYLLTPWCRVLLEQLIGLQLIKKFPAFHGTRRFITALTAVPPTVSILGQPNPVHIPTSHLQEIHPNIIHLSMPMSPQWSPPLRFPHQDPIHPPLLAYTRHMPSPLVSCIRLRNFLKTKHWKSDVCVTVYHWYNNINSQLDATITNLIDNYHQLNMPASSIISVLYHKL